MISDSLSRSNSHGILGPSNKVSKGEQRPSWMEPLPGSQSKRTKQAADDVPRANKLRRSSGKVAKKTEIAKATAAALRSRTLALTHNAPPPGAQNDADMLATMQWAEHDFHVLTGLTAQSLTLGGITAGAAGATVGLAAQVAANAGSFYPGCGMAALILSCLDIFNAEVNAKDARQHYLAALVLLADNQRVLAEIGQRAQDGATRPEDASLKQITETGIASLQAIATHFETGFFRDAQSPHAQETRRSLDEKAQTLVALKREYDANGYGERLHQLKQRLKAPGLDEGQRAGIQDDIDALEQRLEHLLNQSRALHKAMGAMHSHKRMQDAAKKSLAEARETLEKAQHEAFLRALPHGPDLPGQIAALRFQRRVILLKELRKLQLMDQPPLVVKTINMEFIERWEAEMLSETTVAALEAALAQIHSAELHAVDTEIAQAEAALQVQQADAKAIADLQQQVQALEKDVEHLDRRLDKVLIAPLGDRGPAELDRLRDGALSMVMNLLDAGATFNSASFIWNLLPSILSSLYLIMPLALIGMFAGMLDIQRGKRGMAQATNAKGPLITKAGWAGQLFQAYSQDQRPAVASLQYALHARLETIARQTRAMHHLSAFSKARKFQGAQSIAMGGLVVVLGILTLIFGVPFVAGPAVAGGAFSTRYLKEATGFLFHMRKQKHINKQQETVARAFVKRFGPDAIAELHRDMAEGHPGRWDERLRGFRHELKGRRIPAGLLQPHALATNVPLNIQRLTRALVDPARNHQAGASLPEADLVSTLAATQGLPDPASWKPEGFASPQAYEQAVRASLSQLFGWTPPAAQRRSFKNPRELKRVATQVDTVLNEHLSHRNALSDQESFASWIEAVAQQPETFGDRLAQLDETARRRLREQVMHLGKVLRQAGIGPRELLILQATSVTPVKTDKAGRPVKPHPLQAYPLLMTPKAHCLLELIADPSPLAEPSLTAPAQDVPAAVPPATTVPLAAPADAQPTGADLVSSLTTSIKTVGASRRDGGAVHRPRLPREAGDTAAPRLRRRGLPRRAKHKVQTGVKAVAKHVYQQMPNPMATPAQALEQMAKTHSDAELQELLQQIVLEFAKEVGGANFELKKNPKLAAELPDDASATDLKRAHLRALVKKAGQSAGSTAANIQTMSENGTRHAKDMDRMAQRMKDTELLCASLNNVLLNNTLAWEATLQPITVA